MTRSSSPIRNQDGSSLPQRPLARGLDEPFLRAGALGYRHPRRLRSGHIGAEHVVEAVLMMNRSVVPSLRGTGRSVASPSMLPGNLPASAKQLSPSLRGEGVGVDEPDDVAGVRRNVGDHRASVGVCGEHDGPVDRADDVADGGGVRGNSAQRVGRGDHRVSGVEQHIDDGVPARGLGEGAVDENDGGGHGRSFRVGSVSGRTCRGHL